MQLKTLHSLFRTVVESHVKDIRFFTGLEKDFDPANNAQYPGMLVLPIDVVDPINPGELIYNWNMIAAYKELLPEDRTPETVNEVLNSTLEVIRQIMLKFILDYGFAEVMFEGEKIDFTVLPPGIRYEVIIDDGADNAIGWRASFTLQEPVNPATCCLDDFFT